ncbi:hypothetical protein [Flavobacterium litorale]|uniref:hypothetical protein n=1 Tax=Flavobacterium litorale TaxID=2856519 RepID=UPI002103A075|nr:hypothetical protein [Flavobacterium litorale]
MFDYIFNYDYIAQELCENKAKPELQCNGKCHLMKELAKAAEDEQPLSEKKVVHQEREILFCQAVVPFSFRNYTGNITNKEFTLYNNLYSHLVVTSVFHPPVFIS